MTSRENHLTGTNTGVSVVYDGDGNRVSEMAGGVTTQYLVDDRNPTGYAQVLEEVVNGTVQRSYTYGLDLISENQASGTSFYGYDGHGNVRLLTDAGGTVTDRYDYDTFGDVVSRLGSTPNVYLYSGQQFDLDLNLYYNRARYLNVQTGRFWSMDTVGIYIGNGDMIDAYNTKKGILKESDILPGVPSLGYYHLFNLVDLVGH